MAKTLEEPAPKPSAHLNTQDEITPQDTHFNWSDVSSAENSRKCFVHGAHPPLPRFIYASGMVNCNKLCLAQEEDSIGMCCFHYRKTMIIACFAIQ